MGEQNRMTVARDVLASIVVAGAFAAAAAVASSATVAADPPPPPPGGPAVPAPPPAGPPVPIVGAPLGQNALSPLAQSGDPAPGPLGIPESSRDEMFLGQSPVPAAPGGPPGTPPPLRAFNNGYWLPQNEVPSAPGEGKLFDVAPGQENANISGLEGIRRWYRLYKDGRMEGGLLGQRDHSQLGAPLPGTAPPPGTNIPPGLNPPVLQPVPAPAGAPPEPEAPPPPPVG